MGTNDKNAPSAAPPHSVSLKEKFAIGQHGVTNTEFVAFLNASLQSGNFDPAWVLTDRDSPTSPLMFGLKRFMIAAGHENHPVAGISWRGVQAYVAWLSS